MTAARNFIVLNDKNMALTNNAAGIIRMPFRQTDLNETFKTTVSFKTDSPCLAVIDNTGIQWDLGSRRVWYNDGWVTIDLIDIMNAENMIIEESTITIAGNKVYTRYRAGDTASGYCWRNAGSSPAKLYTRTEYPEVDVDYAYETGKIPSPDRDEDTAKHLVKGYTAAEVDSIEGVWEALFPLFCGVEFTILED